MELHRLGGLADRTLTRPRSQTATRARASVAGFEQWTALCKPFQAAAVPRRCPFQHVIRRTPLKRRVHADSAVDTESLDSFRRRLQLRQLEDAVRLAQPPQTSGQHDTSPLDATAASSPLPQTSNSSSATPVTATNSASGPGPQTINSSSDTAIPALNAASSHLPQASSSSSSSASHHTSADTNPASAANSTTTSGLIDLPTTADIVTPERSASTVLQQSTSESVTGAAPFTPPQDQQLHIPRPILILSCVSMGLTMASCVFNSLMPVYMVTELHMSMRSMGMLEGILEAFSYLVRMCSGIVSDLLANRKLTITAGFAMGAMAKFGLSFSTTVTQVFIGKAIDKLGNGVQAAPRDAMIGDLAPPQHRSSCFGFAQSLRKWGSTLGALSAYLLMRASDNNYQAIFLMAASLSAISTVAFTILVPASTTKQVVPQQQQQQQVHETVQQQQPSAEAVPPPPKQTAGQQWQALQANAKALGPKFFQFLLVVGLYGCGHIGESLLEARAVEVGFGKAEATLVVALLCFVVFLSAYPLGRLADKYGQRFTFSLGMASLIAGDLVLLTSSFFPPAVFIACVFWGMHWAVVQGPLLSIVVQLSPPHLRGTAFGIFYTVMAVTALAANTVFGYIWHTYSATAAFGLSAAIITATLIALPWLLPSEQQQEQQGGEQQLKLKLA